MKNLPYKPLKGQAAIIGVLLTFVILLAGTFGTASIALKETRIANDGSRSLRAFYAAEAGIDDAVYRARSGKNISPSFSISLNNTSAAINVFSVGDTKTITAEGNSEQAIRGLEAVIKESTTDVQFFYGVQIGSGGLLMANNSEVEGNVFSNGNIIGGTGSKISGDAIVAGGLGNPEPSWTITDNGFVVGGTSGTLIAVIDSSGDTGEYDSIVLGSDGFARISYYDATNDDLKFVRCFNADCAGKNITIVDAAGDIGWRYIGIGIGNDGFAQISYYDNTNDDLKFAHCTNDDCTGKNIVVLDSSGDVGQFSSLAIGPDGFARISYYRISSGDLKFVRCADVDCAAKTVATIDSTNDVGKYSSIAIGSDGFARISYRDETSDDLKFARCIDADCSAKNIVIVDSSGNIADFPTSLKLGSDDFARISYYDATNDDLKFAKCLDTDCSSSNIATVDSSGNVGKYTSLVLGAGDLARISYYDGSNGAVKFVACGNLDCTSKNVSTVDSAGDSGHYTSLALGADGFGRISYHDETNGDLKFIRCADASCSLPTQQTDVGQSFTASSDNVLRRVDLYIKKVGNPANATVRILIDEGGHPGNSGGDTLTTGTLSASSVGATYSWVPITLSSNPALANNTKYWIVVDTNNDSGNYYVWGIDSTDAYSGGTGEYSLNWALGASSWNSTGGDLAFRAYLGGANTRIEGVIIGNASFGTGRANEFVDMTIHGTQCPNQYCIIDNVPREELPISDGVIDDWKTDARSGGTISGDYSVAQNISLGPKEITGNLLMTSNNKILNITGTIYVHGNIDIDNGSAIQCDSSYNENSCAVFSDGWIHIANNGVFFGSGNPSSFIMLLSTLPCDGTNPAPPCDTAHHNGAIDIHNSAEGAIFYASDGMLHLHNTVRVQEAVAEKVELDQNAAVSYDSGLANSTFSSGPGGGWGIESWAEIAP